MLPASLASYGNISLISWVLSGIGAIALALIYSWLARIMPIAQGGPMHIPGQAWVILPDFGFVGLLDIRMVHQCSSGHSL